MFNFMERNVFMTINKRIILIMFLSIIYFLIITKTTFATTGTDEGFYSFGYYRKTQDVILFYGGQEGSPIIWSYNIITNNISKNYLGFSEDYYSAYQNLQKDLTPLKKVELKDTQLVIKQEKFPVEQRLYEGEDFMFDVYLTQITIQDLKNSTTQTKIFESCFQDLPILLDGIYEYPDKNIQIVVFRYNGVCFEGGYMKDTAFFFPEPKSETSGPPIKVYTIQVVASKTIKNLDNIKNKLMEFGQEPYIEKFVDKSNITWYRLRTGAYVYRSDAEETAKKLRYLLSIEPFVLAIEDSENREVIERTSTDKPDILKDVILPKEFKIDEDIIRDQNANKNIETNIIDTTSGQKEFKIDLNKAINKNNYNGNAKTDNFILLFIIIVGFIIIIIFLGLLIFMKKSTMLLFFGLSFVSIAILGWMIVYAMFSTSLNKEKQKLKQRTTEAQNQLIQSRKEKIKEVPKIELRSDWKTYKNVGEYGFEIKYPANFFTNDRYKGISIDSENFDGEINVTEFFGKERKSMEECIINSEDISLEQGVSAYRDQKTIASTTFYHFSNYPEFIGGYCGMSTGCHYKDIYRTFYNDSCYQIEYERSDREFMEGNPYNNPKILGDVGKVPDIFYEIFSTFRFLK